MVTENGRIVMAIRKKKVLCTLFVIGITLGSVNADFVVDTISVGTNPYAVAINPATNRTYIANYSSGTITVINGATSDTIGTIAVGTNPRAVAVNALNNKIYVANSTASTVSVIDGTTNTVAATVAVRSMPNAIAINPASNKVYITNYGSANVSVINCSTNVVDATVPVGLGPIAICVNPVTNKIYVANSGSSNVAVIDGATNDTTVVPAGSSPSSIAANTVTDKIYVTNSGDNNITVIDGTTNDTATIATGNNPVAVAVNFVTDTVYVANASGNSVTVIDGVTGAAVNVVAGTTPSSLAINTTTNKIYVTNYGNNSVSVLSGAVTDTTLTVGTNPNAVAVNSITNKIYVGNNGSANVTVITDGISRGLGINTGTNANGLIVNPVTNRVYVANYGSNDVTIFDGGTNTTTTVPVGTNPRALAMNPVTNKIYVANKNSNNVTIIDGSTDQTLNVPTGNNPWAIAVNVVTNKIYVGDSGSNKVTVIDGTTNDTFTVTVGHDPGDIAVNPVTNKIYVTNYDADNFDHSTVSVIDGITNQTTSIDVERHPMAVAVNPVTNKIYVVCWANGNNLWVIDGATNLTASISTGNYSGTIAVNSVTNRIYIPSSDHNLTVIDGATNQVIARTYLGDYSQLTDIAMNTVTNMIYVANGSNQIVSIIDGATNQLTTLSALYAKNIAVNPVTGKTYAEFYSVRVIDEALTYYTKLKAFFDVLPNNATISAQPSLTGKAVNRLSPGRTGVAKVLTAMSTTQSLWSNASITGGAGTDSASWTWIWGTDTLLWGENFLCVVALDSQAACANNVGIGTFSAGNSIVYPIYRISNLTPPMTPVLVSPVNNVTNQPTDLTFSWNRATGASSYYLQVATDTGFSAITFSRNLISDTSIIVNGLIVATFYWRVCASNSAGTTSWSSTWIFSTIIAAPSTPQPLSPSNGAINISTNPLLSWNAAARAASYSIQVATDSNFSSTVVHDSGITDTFHTITGLSSFTLYYWRVRAANAGGTSGSSSTWNFITGATAVLPFDLSLPHAFSISGFLRLVRYSLPIRCHVSLKYYDLRGRLIVTIVNNVQGPGEYVLPLRNALSSHGTYIRVFEAEAYVKKDIITIVQ